MSWMSTRLAAVTAILTLPAAAWAGFDHGPWVQAVTSSSVEILIEGDDNDDPGSIDYGLTPGYGSSVAMTRYFGPQNKSEMFRGQISGLTGDTRYYYRVNHEGVSVEGSFFTTPPPGQTFSFAVIGDCRSNHTAHTNVTQALTDHFGGAYPDLYFNTGDLVADGTDEDDWDIFFSIENGTGLLHNTVFNATFGNHEESDLFEPTLFYRYFSAHAAENNNGWYSFDYGNAHFTIINTQASCQATGAQGQWVDADLAAADADPDIDFKFVFFHEPGVTTGSSHGPAACITGSNGMIDLFEKHNVDIAFAGHNHQYEHTLMNGLHSVVQGGGGAGNSGFDRTSAFTVYKDGIYAFTTVTVSASSYTAETYQVDGVSGGAIGMVDTWTDTPGDGGFPGPTADEFKPGADGCSVPAGGSGSAGSTLVLLGLPWLAGRIRRRR